MRRFFCAVMCVCFLILPVQAEPAAKYVALTFDDGPSGRFTRQLLDGLQARNVKATFFLCGYRIKDYPQEAKRILEEGHEVGCHGYSHKSMQTMNRRDLVKEIIDTQALLPESCQVNFLRPPGGCCSDSVRQIAEARKLAILSWSVDPRDWATDDVNSIETFVLERVKDGDVILLHDMSGSSVKAALDIVDQLQQQGYQFATASQLAAMRRISLRPGKTYCCFPRREDQE